MNADKPVTSLETEAEIQAIRDWLASLPPPPKVTRTLPLRHAAPFTPREQQVSSGIKPTPPRA